MNDYTPNLENNQFLCFHCRKTLSYNECGLDFKEILPRPRILICDFCYKKIGIKVSQSIENAGKEEVFKCWIDGKTYLLKEELALELEANEFHERLMICKESATKGLVENCRNRNLF